jgi:hypothetical protein
VSRAQGIHGSGTREFTQADVERVRKALSRDTHLTVAQLAGMTGCEGRTVRAVLSALDGEELLLAGGDDGYKIATSWDEAEPLTRRLDSQARKMAARVERRRRLAATLERKQGLLL